MNRSFNDSTVELDAVWLFDLRLAGGAAYDIGAGPHGHRRIRPILGGEFDGPRCSGTVLPSGVDRALIRSDGVFEPDAALVLEATDGALIHMQYQGRWYAYPDGVGQLIERNPGFERTENRLRVAAFFETAAEDHRWLNDILAVGVGRITATGVDYSFYEIQ